MLELSPTITINEALHTISISGNSLPENPIAIYKPVFDYFNNLKTENKPAHIAITIDVELFNSSSLKTIIELFNALKELEANSITHNIKWMYSDSESLEKGETAASIIPVDINFNKK
jgi:hypothetical protein